jgi:hypothetical protein
MGCGDGLTEDDEGFEAAEDREGIVDHRGATGPVCSCPPYAPVRFFIASVRWNW